jgi:DNA-binding transcriptional ArsR family regulator
MDKSHDNQDNKNLENMNKVSLFYNNPTLSFIHKKIEKISCALYLVTNHLPDSEPLKWVLRETSIDFLKDILSLGVNFSNIPTELDRLKEKSAEILSYLNLLSTSGLISITNHKIISDEVLNISSFLHSGYDFANYPDSDFSKDFFNVSGLLPQEKNRIGYFGSVANNDFYSSSLNTKDILKGQDKRQSFIKNMSFIKKTDFEKNVSNNSDNTQNQGSKRKKEILSLVEEKKDVSIKDILLSIKGFSEKTLQRDLTSLVSAGVLKREGERRWSRYKLA